MALTGTHGKEKLRGMGHMSGIARSAAAGGYVQQGIGADPARA